MPSDAAGSSDRQRRHRWIGTADVRQPSAAGRLRRTGTDHAVRPVTRDGDGDDRAVDQAHDAGASEVSVTFIGRGGAKTLASTGQLATDLDERQYRSGYGPCLASVEGGEPIVINDMRSDHRWRDWASQAVERGAGSSLSIPVPVQREVMAALNIYSTGHNAFDHDSIELARTFGAYAGVALANMHLYQAQGQMAEQLQNAMESRSVIEQAKGILMGERRCSTEDAFDIPINLSQDSNRKLREVAQALVDHATGGGSSDG